MLATGAQGRQLATRSAEGTNLCEAPDGRRGKQEVFFFNDTATTEIFTLSLHVPLPICKVAVEPGRVAPLAGLIMTAGDGVAACERSEEHTSELQSLRHLVCRLLLE